MTKPAAVQASVLLDKDPDMVEFEKALTPAHIKQLQVQDKADQLQRKYDSIAKAIYRHYSPQKQAQDEKWISTYTIKLKAADFPALEATVIAAAVKAGSVPIVDVVTPVIGALPESVLAKIEGASKAERTAYATQMLTKLVKIAGRSQWAENTIIEGKAAIAGNRAPAFPAFPARRKP